MISARLFAIMGAFVALAPCFGSACGGSPATTAPPGPDASLEASVRAPMLVQVVTGGGGAATSSSSGATIDPFAGSSSSGGGPPDDGGSPPDDGGPGDGTLDGPSDGASTDVATDSGDGAANACDSYATPMCGATPCDLRTHTCCLTLQLAARCLAGRTAACNSNEATVHCANACDCAGQSCCGVLNTLVGIAESICEPVPSGGICQPNPQTVTQASAQLCTVSSECQNGQPCINQTCVAGATFNICGLQSQDPFYCTAN